jgi:hypothetical protein
VPKYNNLDITVKYKYSFRNAAIFSRFVIITHGIADSIPCLQGESSYGTKLVSKPKIENVQI